MLLEVRKTDAFEVWLRGLRDQRGKAKIVARIDRLALGNPGDVAPVGDGVSELRIQFGPGLLRATRKDGRGRAVWRTQRQPRKRHSASEVTGGRVGG